MSFIIKKSTFRKIDFNLDNKNNLINICIGNE